MEFDTSFTYVVPMMAWTRPSDSYFFDEVEENTDSPGKYVMCVLDMLWHEEGAAVVNNQPWEPADRLNVETLHFQRGRPGMHTYVRGQ